MANLLGLSLGSNLTLGVWIAAEAGLVVLLASMRLTNLRLKRDMRKALYEQGAKFSAIASHYLLSPITIIQMAVNQLQEQDATLTSSERQHLYETIVRGQQRLWITSEQLLVSNEIDNGRFSLSLRVAQPKEVVSDAIVAVDPFSRDKNVKVKFQSDDSSIQSETRVDPRHLKQALVAVLDNAIKFTPEGGTVSVWVGLVGDIWTIRIEDTGIGMSPEVLSHTSDNFYRGTSVYDYDYDGLGMGLHLARSIIRMHQGNISFVSKPKKGTLVTIEFPNQ
jgi:signal transduction histidine kinase